MSHCFQVRTHATSLTAVIQNPARNVPLAPRQSFHTTPGNRRSLAVVRRQLINPIFLCARNQTMGH